jgi:hypothetical protein
MIYWSHINLFGTLITSILSTVLVTLFFFGRFKVDASMPFVLKLFWAFWNQTTVFAFLITFAYWTFLYRKDEITFQSVVIHALNSVVAFMELCIVRHPPRYSHFFYVSLSCFFYGIFTVSFQFLGGVNA